VPLPIPTKIDARRRQAGGMAYLGANIDAAVVSARLNDLSGRMIGGIVCVRSAPGDGFLQKIHGTAPK